MKRVIHHFKRHYQERYVKPHGVRAHIILTIDGVLIAIILGLLALGSYFAFYYNPLRDSFKVAFDIPEELRAGEVATIGVSVTNGGEEALRDLSVTVFFPPQFLVSGITGTTESSGVIEIGSLGPGITETYLFRGLLLGAPSETTIFAEVSGATESGEQDERVVSTPLVWEENAVGLSWNLPEAAVAGQTLSFSVVIENGSNINFDRLRFKPRLPERYSVSASTPPLTKDGAFIGKLSARESISVSVVGRLEYSETAVPFSGDLVWERESGDISVAQVESAVVPIDVNIELEIRDVPAVVRPGETFSMKIRYANNGDEKLKNVRVRLPLDPQFVDITASKAVDGGRTERFLAWESVTLTELEELAPGESGELTAELAMLSPVQSLDTNRRLELYPEIIFNLEEPALENVRISDTTFSTKVSGEAKLSGVARYFTNEGDQIGRGPLPPRAGAVTKYWIVLKVDTGSTKTTSGRVVIQLPPNVKWTGRSAVTEGFELERVLGGLVWNIGAIEAFAGDKRPAPNASFEIALTPGSEQVGTEPILIRSAEFSGKDDWTDILLESSQGELTTNLSTDPFIKGRTVVK